MNSPKQSHVNKSIIGTEIFMSFVMIIAFNIFGVILVILYFFMKFFYKGKIDFGSDKFSENSFGNNITEFLEALANQQYDTKVSKKNSSSRNTIISRRNRGYDYNTKHNFNDENHSKYVSKGQTGELNKPIDLFKENIKLEEQKNTKVKKVKIASIWDNYESVSDQLKKKYKK